MRKTVRRYTRAHIRGRLSFFAHLSLLISFSSIPLVDGNKICALLLSFGLNCFLSVYGWDDVFSPPPRRRVGGVYTPSASISVHLSWWIEHGTEMKWLEKGKKNKIKIRKSNRKNKGEIRDPHSQTRPCVYRVICPPPSFFFPVKTRSRNRSRKKPSGRRTSWWWPLFFFNNHLSFLFVFQHYFRPTPEEECN